jgi:hypothetical protein
MDLAILEKKISSYKTATVKLTKVPDELIMEILGNWERWTGPAAGFYSEIGVSAKKMAGIIGKGKKLKRDGFFSVSDFTELKLSDDNTQRVLGPCNGVEVLWDGGKVLSFGQIDLSKVPEPQQYYSRW